MPFARGRQAARGTGTNVFSEILRGVTTSIEKRREQDLEKEKEDLRFTRILQELEKREELTGGREKEAFEREAIQNAAQFIIENGITSDFNEAMDLAEEAITGKVGVRADATRVANFNKSRDAKKREILEDTDPRTQDFIERNRDALDLPAEEEAAPARGRERLIPETRLPARATFTERLGEAGVRGLAAIPRAVERGALSTAGGVADIGAGAVTGLTGQQFPVAPSRFSDILRESGVPTATELFNPVTAVQETRRQGGFGNVLRSLRNR